MNARLYDPVVGRFLSPDPYVQAPFMSQNFNRYSYGLNNPLRYTDPSGEIIPLIIAGAIIGATINVVMNWDNINNGGFHWDKAFSYAGIGAVTGGVIAGTGFVGGALICTFSGAANSFVRSDYNLSWDMAIQGGVSGVSFVATAGLTKGLPGGKGLGLDSKIANFIGKAGVSKYAAAKAGEYVVNYGVNFTMSVTSDVITGTEISFKRSATSAFWSSTMTLSLGIAQDQFYFKMQSDKNSIPNQADRAIEAARSSSTDASTPPSSTPNPSIPQNQKPYVPKQTPPNRGTKSNPYNSNDFWNKLKPSK